MYAYYCSRKEGDLVTRSWHIYILFQLDSEDVYLLILYEYVLMRQKSNK